MYKILLTLIVSSLLYSFPVAADYKNDIAYTRLHNLYGENLMTGQSVITSHIEAAVKFVDHDKNPSTQEWPVYLPQSNTSYLVDKSIYDITQRNSGVYSSHAKGVARYFYGDKSVAYNISAVNAYWVDHWLQSGYLNANGTEPKSLPDRIANHSWVANISDSRMASKLLQRLDWAIDKDEFIQVVGTRNKTGTNANLLSAAFNSIAVGRTDGSNSTGSSFIDATYTTGRARTEIVAPFKVTSTSTPVVAASAALLVDLGHSKPELSTDSFIRSTLNRNKNTIYNAERSEVIKAALLAGADRVTDNSLLKANISDYRQPLKNQTHNGLDFRYGAGQLNIFNSYQIIAAGEQNNFEDSAKVKNNISDFGFDFDASFGGANNNNKTASYYFSSNGKPQTLYVSLVWNINIQAKNKNNSFSTTAKLYDLDLILYDITDGKKLMIRSASSIDNSENIWIALNKNRKYLLQVICKKGQVDFDWDYALAWRITPDKNRPNSVGIKH